MWKRLGKARGCDIPQYEYHVRRCLVASGAHQCFNGLSSTSTRSYTRAGQCRTPVLWRFWRTHGHVCSDGSQRGQEYGGGTTMPNNLCASLRASHISSFKTDGYYRLENPKLISLDPTVYEVRTMRGGGPGGQGTNSSSNKVELRVSLTRLGDFFDDELIAALRKNEAGRSITLDGSTLVVSSHEYRSALQNKEDCIFKVKGMIREASWVPPEDRDRIQRPGHLIEQRKHERRKKATLVTALHVRFCSDDVKGCAPSYKSSLGRLPTREQIFPDKYEMPEGVDRQPKHERLVKMWREPSPLMSSSEGADVAQLYGGTFQDTRDTPADETTETKRRRLLYQSQYRGMVEMDLILGNFARCKLGSLDAVLLDEFDTLLKVLDNDLFAWLVMGQEAPKEIAGMKCFDELKSFVHNERKELLGHY